MYKGIIKNSRTLDLVAVSAILDAVALGFLAYSPQQLGIAVPDYAAVRIVLTAVQAYLRFKTSGPVGEK